MTVSTEDFFISYSGDDATSEFDFSFKVWADTHLTVIKKLDAEGTETELTLNSDYTVSRNSDQESDPGGSITLTGDESPSDSDYSYWIIANIPNTQTFDGSEGDSFPVESIETALDKITMQLKQQATGILRSLRISVPDYNDGDVSTEMPSPEASKLIGFNAAANALALYTASTVIGASTDLSDFPSSLVASKILQVKADGSGWELVDNIGSVSDTAYDATSWNGVTTIAPSKNAVRDKFEALTSYKIIQVVNTQVGALATGTTIIPPDDTKPQKTEGDEYMTLAVTPTSATNKLKIDIVWIGAHSAGDHITAALFQDTTADALATAVVGNLDTPSSPRVITFSHYMTAGTTSETTFKVRVGANNAGIITFNGFGGNRKFGGIMASSITISEIEV